jgi:GNAT superfamily N-acetyltransferase
VIDVRRLEETDLEAVNRALHVWSSREYARRLDAQRRGELVQAIAWLGSEPIGRGMVLLPDHEEYSISAHRERCAEVRDVFVAAEHRRSGVARAMMAALERAAREAGMVRVGLSVSLSDDAAPARALYARLGYRHAHGPYVSSTNLDGDDDLIPVGAVMSYLVRER